MDLVDFAAIKFLLEILHFMSLIY